MVKHNNQLVNNHFRKDWDKRVRTWFNQPARKVRRRDARKVKAAAIHPRPVSGNLRPLVHAPTQRYNFKVRAGRGFTLGELKAAGINSHNALGLGITVDYRRKDKNRETLNANVQRLKLYTSKQVLFPKKATKIVRKKGAKNTVVKTTQPTEAVVQQIKPFPHKVVVAHESARKITPEMQSASAYKTLVHERIKLRKVGDAAKKAAAAANIVGGDAK